MCSTRMLVMPHNMRALPHIRGGVAKKFGELFVAASAVRRGRLFPLLSPADAQRAPIREPRGVLLSHPRIPVLGIADQLPLGLLHEQQPNLFA